MALKLYFTHFFHLSCKKYKNLFKVLLKIACLTLSGPEDFDMLKGRGGHSVIFFHFLASAVASEAIRDHLLPAGRFFPPPALRHVKIFRP